MTNDLQRRVEQHRANDIPGFTRNYGVTRLVYAQRFGGIRDAIDFEKRLKRWRRHWKIRLIEETNCNWEDLYLQMMADPAVSPCSWIPDSRCAASGMTNWRDELRERWTVKLT